MRDIEVSVQVDPYEVADVITQQGEKMALDFIIAIDENMCDLSFSESLRDYFIEVCAREYEAEAEANKSTTAIPWPMSLNDPAVAVHEAAERGHCEARNPLNCFSVSHRTILGTIEYYNTWLKHRGVNVDELLVSR